MHPFRKIETVLILAFLIFSCEKKSSLSVLESSGSLEAPPKAAELSPVTLPSFSNSLTSSPQVNWVSSKSSQFEIAIGTEANNEDTLDWTSVGQATSYQATGLSLTHGQSYFAKVREVGSQSHLVVGSWMVDTEKPSPAANLLDNADYHTPVNQSPAHSWSPASDVLSGIAKYELAIGTTSGSADLLTWFDVGNVLSYQVEQLSLTSGEDYFVSLRAIDRAGNIGDPITSDGWIAGPYCVDKSSWITYNAFGAGTEESPYQICNAAQLANIGIQSAALSASYRLMGNIDFASYYAEPNLEFQIGQCDPAGCSSNPGTHAFTGTFDGNGFTLSNFSFISPTTRGSGLFATINRDGMRGVSLKDLNLSQARISGATNVGVIGYTHFAIVRGIHVTGDITGNGQHVGGVIGYTYSSIIGESSFSGTITNTDGNTGGIAGYASESGKGHIFSCSSSGQISGTAHVGGIVGYLSDSIVSNSHSSMTVTGSGARVGGLVGSVGWSQAGVVNSYATGHVTGGLETGGLVGGISYEGSIHNSFATGQVTGLSGDNSRTGQLLGFDVGGYGYIFNSYYHGSSGCDSGAGACNNIGSNHNDLQMFYSSANPPLSSWDSSATLSDGPADLWHFSDSDFPIAWYQEEPDGFVIPFLGTGTASSPYLISSVAEFNLIGQNPRWSEAHFKLTNNLDFFSQDFYQIGGDSLPFMGSFDGSGLSLANIENRQSTRSYVGIFGNLRGTLTNLTTTNVTVEGFSKVGGMIGAAMNSEVNRLRVSGSVTGNDALIGGVIGFILRGQSISHLRSYVNVSGTNQVGGIFGSVSFSTNVDSSYSEGTVSGVDQVGGLTGFSQNNNINDSFSKSNVTSTGSNVGGLIGYFASSDINRCYTTGDVLGVGSVGGIIGESAVASVDINDSFATGNITGANGSTEVGPLLGLGPATITNSYYWSGATCDSTGSGGSCNTNGTPVATESDFYSSANAPLNTWSTPSIWLMGGSDYPTLYWGP